SGAEFDRKVLEYAEAHPTLRLLLDLSHSSCQRDGKQSKSPEPHCWIERRFDTFRFIGFEDLVLRMGAEVTLKLNLMTPWKGQRLTFSAPGWSSTIEPEQWKVGSFSDYLLKIPSNLFRPEQIFTLQLSKVLSPKIQGLGNDNRRLGVAIA